jgi:hypothetical protein
MLVRAHLEIGAAELPLYSQLGPQGGYWRAFAYFSDLSLRDFEGRESPTKVGEAEGERRQRDHQPVAGED